MVNKPDKSESDNEIRHQEELPVLDKEAIEQLRDLDDPGDSSFFTSTIEAFLRSVTDHIESLGQAIDSRNVDKLRKETHSLCGSCGMYGAIRMAYIASGIGKSGKAGSWDDVNKQFETLGKEFILVKEEFNREMQEATGK